MIVPYSPAEPVGSKSEHIPCHDSHWNSSRGGSDSSTELDNKICNDIYIYIYYAFNLGFSKNTLLHGTYMYPLHPLTPFHSRVNHGESSSLWRFSQPSFPHLRATAAHLSKHLGTCEGIQIIILRLPWWRKSMIPIPALPWPMASERTAFRVRTAWQ